MKTPSRPFPWQRNGFTYCFDNAGNRICTGAAMGRRNAIPADKDTVKKLHLRRVAMSACGAYDTGGAYWGIGKPLFCAWGESDTEQAQAFFRAKDRSDAKVNALRIFPGAAFFR